MLEDRGGTGFPPALGGRVSACFGDLLCRTPAQSVRGHRTAAGVVDFRRVTGDPVTVAAFDAAFGGPVRHAPRAA